MLKLPEKKIKKMYYCVKTFMENVDPCISKIINLFIIKFEQPCKELLNIHLSSARALCLFLRKGKIDKFNNNYFIIRA